VTSVKVVKARDRKTQLVQILSTRRNLRKEDAVKALGKDAKKYVVQTWALRE
jgi:hypothetical protein